jgi:hypothetical protein
MMRLGVGAVGGKIGGHGINLSFNLVNPRAQGSFDTVNLFTQHLGSFDNDIQLLLKIFRHNADMMLERILDLFKIISFHMNLPQTFLTVENKKSRPLSTKLTRAASDLPLYAFPTLVKMNGGQPLKRPLELKPLLTSQKYP